MGIKYICIGNRCTGDEFKTNPVRLRIVTVVDDAEYKEPPVAGTHGHIPWEAFDRSAQVWAGKGGAFNYIGTAKALPVPDVIITDDVLNLKNKISTQSLIILDGESTDGEYNSWSGVLAGVTEHGFPIVHHFYAGWWAVYDKLPDDMRDKIQPDHEVILLPNFKKDANTSWVVCTPKGARVCFESKGALSVQVEMELIGEADKEPFIDLSGVAGMESRSLERSGSTDWRAELPLTAGRDLDPLDFLATVSNGLTAPDFDIAEICVSLGSYCFGLGLGQPPQFGEIEDTIAAPRAVTEALLWGWTGGNGYGEETRTLQRTYGRERFMDRTKRDLWSDAMRSAISSSGNAAYQPIVNLLDSNHKRPEADQISQILRVCHAAFTDEDVLLRLWHVLWLRNQKESDRGKYPILSEILGNAEPGGPSATILNRLRDGLARSARGMATRYGDELAGLHWQAITRRLRIEERSIVNGKADANASAERLRARSLAEGMVELLKASSREQMERLSRWLTGDPAWEKPDSKFFKAIEEWILNRDASVKGNPLRNESETTARGLGRDVPEQEKPLTRCTTTPLPLRFAIPDLETPPDLDEPPGSQPDGPPDTRHANIRGVLVFCRRTPGDSGYCGTDGSKWLAINLGTIKAVMKDGSAPIVLAGLAPIPIGMTVNNRVASRIASYFGDPLGVHLIKNRGLEDVVQSEDPADPQPLPVSIERYQLDPSNDQKRSPWLDEWCLTLAMGYGWSYHFLLAPIFRDGSLHRDFLREQADERSTDGVPLKTVAEINCFIREKIKYWRASGGNYIQSRRLLRTVAVGPLRLITRRTGGAGTANRFDEARIPTLPKTVVPLSSTVLGLMSDKAEAERLRRAPVLVLYGGSDDLSPNQLRPAHSDPYKFEFEVRPSAAGLEDWICWTRRYIAGTSFRAHTDTVAKAESLIRRSTVDGKIQFPGGLQIPAADLLDDGAVEGYVVRTERLYSLANGYRSDDSVDRFETAVVKDLELLGDIDRIAGVESLKDYRRRFSGSFTIVRSFSPKGELKGTKLCISPGEVWRVTVFPCLKKTSVAYFSEDIREGLFAEVPFDPEWVIAQNAGLVILAEATHPTLLESKQFEKATCFARLPGQYPVWRSLCLDMNQETSRLKIYVKPESAGGSGDVWANVYDLQVTVQTWRWNGIPPWSREMESSSFHPGLALVEGDSRRMKKPSECVSKEHRFSDRFYEAEYRAFATRSNEDALIATGTLQWLPNVKLDVEKALILIGDGPAEILPRYHRARLRVRSRYFGLPGYEEELVDGERQIPGCSDPWQRIVTHTMRDVELQVPRVKMVVPLLTGAVGARPGFLVLLHETLPTPFHTLSARIDVASVRRSSDGSVLRAPEAGRDPITNDVQESLEPLVEGAPLLGRAMGLSFEREAGSPLFPHAAFIFDKLPGELSDKICARATDWFLKLRFHWERCVGRSLPSSLSWDCRWALAEEDIGPETGASWVRVLSQFESVHDASNDSEVKLPGLGFEEGADSLEFVTRDGKPTLVESKKNDSRFALLFLTFSLREDFFNVENSYAPRAIYLLKRTGPRKLHDFGWPSSNSAPLGRFLRILVAPDNEEDNRSAACRFETTFSANDGNKNKEPMDRLNQIFFPGLGSGANPLMDRLFADDASDKAKSEDAKAMVVRVSEAIAGRVASKT